MFTDEIMFKLILILSLAAFIGILVLIRYFLAKKILIKDVIVVSRLVLGSGEVQEDSVGVTESDNGLLSILADGLGKKEAGRISSEYAVQEISHMFIHEGSREMQNYFFKKAYNKANHEIIRRVERDKGGASVLSTIIVDGYLHYALIGDAMLCIYRNNELFRISKGHSIDVVAKEQYREGKIQKDKAMVVLQDKKLLYYLGHSSYGDVEINTEPIKLYKGDIIVLMSKGIYKNIKWIKLEDILGQKKKKVQELCDEVVQNVDTQSNGSIILMKYTVKNK